METIKQDKSLGRFFRQLFYVPLFRNRWLTADVKATLTQKVTEAETGHRGEVYLVIENSLPLARAYSLAPRTRAIELFAASRVWDTEENTGVLVYVNLCEHDLEIVADRGIDAHVAQSTWQGMCDDALALMRTGDEVVALSELLERIGTLLSRFYELEADPSGNELPDRVLHLS